MHKPHDDRKACLTAFVQDSTLTVVIEMSLRSWLVAGMVPGVNREPRKKIAPNPELLLQLLYRWRDEAIKAGKEITRIAVAYETGRDGFWLARWLRARGIDAHVIHATSVAVSREHRRAKTDRIDTAMLQRGFLGWLRGERGCSNAGSWVCLANALPAWQFILPLLGDIRITPRLKRSNLRLRNAQLLHKLVIRIAYRFHFHLPGGWQHSESGLFGSPPPPNVPSTRHGRTFLIAEIRPLRQRPNVSWVPKFFIQIEPFLRRRRNHP